MIKDIELISFVLFLYEWIDEDEWLDDYWDEEYIEYLAKKWEDEWLPVEEHSGDCTNHPWSCIKCQKDKIVESAGKILNCLKKAKGSSKG